MYTPKVSIVVPVYKVEDNLHKFIKSILAQTYTDFELLLVNDGSPDNCGNICNEYALKDSRIKVFHKVNGGASSARNVGLDKAQGEWIVFADSDDYVDDKWLSTFIDYSAGVDLVVQGFNIEYDPKIKYSSTINGIGNTAGYETCKGHTLDEVKDFVYNLSKKHILGYLWCKMFRKKLIYNLQLRFNESYKLQEDEDFIFKFINTITSFSNNKQGYYNYSYPDYSNKYITDANCIYDIWKSANKLYANDERIGYFAQNYGSLYAIAAAQLYKKNVTHNERIRYLNLFKTEFYRFTIKPTTKRSKLFVQFFLKDAIILSDYIYSLMFRLI